MGGEALAVSEKEREMDDASLSTVGSSIKYNAPDADPCANRSYIRSFQLLNCSIKIKVDYIWVFFKERKCSM